MVDLNLNGPQLAAFRALKPGNTITLAWGRGVGKTWLMRTMWWVLVARQEHKLRKPGTHRGARIIVLMPTLKQFKDVYAADIIEDLEGQWSWLGGKVDRSTWQIEFPGGSWVKPFPAMEHSSKTARGMRADAVFMDEEDDIYPGVFDAVAKPWLSALWSQRIVVGGGTPRKGRYGLHFRQYQNGQLGELIRKGELPDGVTNETASKLRRYYSFFATYRDAPETVAAEAAADAKATTPRAIFQREWEHNFDSAEGLVYGDVWNERFHVRAPPDDVVWSEFLTSGDKGYEDPGVLLLAGKLGHGSDSTLWILDEVYRQHKTADWWCERLGEWVHDFGVRRLYFDPSAADWKASFRSATGVSTADVDNSIDEGVDAVANMLLVREDDDKPWSRLYIHPRCVNLIRELNMYRRRADPKDPDRYTDDIVDRDNHGPDALRYMIAGHFGLKKTLRAA